MHRLSAALLLVCLSGAVPRAQEALSRDQRNADLETLASLYAKNYGPYEWKRDAFGFDLMRLTPWLQRVHHSDDLDFQEALIDTGVAERRPRQHRVSHHVFHLAADESRHL